MSSAVVLAAAMMGGMALSAVALLLLANPRDGKAAPRTRLDTPPNGNGNSQPGTAADPDDMCRAGVVELHNKLRASHGRAPLAWDDRLAASAQRKSETCVFEHLGDSLDGKPLGENLAWGTMPDYTCAQAIQGMYTTEEKPRGDDALLPGGGYNHATQILYPKAKKEGCGRAKCPQYGTFITCMYDIPNGF